MVEYLRPVQERYAELAADPGEVDRLLAVGADAAATIADEVLARATAAAGLLPRAPSELSVRLAGSFHGDGFGEIRRAALHAVDVAEVLARSPATGSPSRPRSALGARRPDRCTTMKFMPSPKPAFGSSWIAVSDMFG